MRKLTFFLMAALFMVQTGVSVAQRGTIVTVAPLATLTPAEIMLKLQLTLDGQSYSLIDLFTYKKYSVLAVKVVYRTIDASGAPTQAAGAVFLPLPASETSMPVYSYLHGTITKFAELPSNLTGIETATGWIMAMDGYISALPDYIGMGAAPGIHPYCHAASEATAAIDMLTAMNYLCAAPEVLSKPNGNLYLSGYSQGAHAALATQRELQANPLPFLTLRKTVAGSGAYSLSAVQKNFMFDHPDYPNPSFIPYLMLGMQSVYGNLYSNLGQVFVPPYPSTMSGYFNGTMDVEEIDGLLPVNWKSMFVPAYLWNFQYKYLNPVNAALRMNDLTNWKPTSDLHLYYCTCDELVAKENTMLAYLSFLQKGSRNVTCMPAGPYTHAACAPTVLLLAKIRFDCASGANPCILKSGPDISLSDAITGEELAMLERAMNPGATLDAAELYSDSQLKQFLTDVPVVEMELSVYPNPAGDQVLVSVPATLQPGSRILMYDMQGRTVLNEQAEGSLIMVDLSRFRQGLYKILITGDQAYSAKLMVTR